MCVLFALWPFFFFYCYYHHHQGELLPQILESGKETTQFDARWFIVRVNESAPRKVRCIPARSSFGGSELCCRPFLPKRMDRSSSGTSYTCAVGTASLFALSRA